MRIGHILRMIAGALRSPWVLFVVAFILRVIVGWQLSSARAAYFYKENEQARIAWAMVSGYGFSSPWPQTPLAPTAQQPPVYPWLLAGIFRIGGAYSLPSLRAAIVLNAAFSALTAVVLYRYGRRRFGDLAALTAAWVWACWIYEIVVSLRVWESSLSALLLAGSIWLLWRVRSAEHALPWLAFGGLAAIAALTNTTLLAVFVGFWIWLWFARARQSRDLSMRWLASIAVCLVLLLPWTIRNYLTFHRLIPVRDNLGMELWIGNHEGVTYLYDFRGGFPLIDPSEYNRLGELAFMEAKRKVALTFIRQHPRDFLRLSRQRALEFWLVPRGSVWWVASLIAWVGLALALWRKRFDAVPEAIVLTLYPLIYYVTHTWSTYRHPIEPVVILMACYAAAELTRRRNVPQKPVPLAVAD